MGRIGEIGGPTDWQAYQLGYRLIAEFHKFRTDQLWNTIDERFMDSCWLPENSHDPENVLYRLPRSVAVIQPMPVRPQRSAWANRRRSPAQRG